MDRRINCVWVIDDDPLQVLILQRLLSTHQSIKSTKFYSGAKSAMDAINSLKGNVSDLPDLIFLDLVMAKGNGWDFLDYYKKIKRKLGRQALIIVLSASLEENARKLQNYSDVSACLSKPLDKKAFREVLENLANSPDGLTP